MDRRSKHSRAGVLSIGLAGSLGTILGLAGVRALLESDGMVAWAWLFCAFGVAMFPLSLWAARRIEEPGRGAAPAALILLLLLAIPCLLLARGAGELGALIGVPLGLGAALVARGRGVVRATRWIAPLVAAFALVVVAVGAFVETGGDPWTLWRGATAADAGALQEACARVDCSAVRDERGRTLLHAAVEAGKEQPVRVLLDAGVSAHAPDDDGMSAFSLAVASGRIDLARLMLEIEVRALTAREGRARPV